MGSETLSKLPVIDFSKEDLNPGSKTWFSTCKEVCQALEDHGCFVAECSDVSLDLHNKVFEGTKELYDLPIEVRKKNTSDKPFRGHFCATSVHDGMGIDNATTLDGIQKFTNLMWPDHGNDPFCESVHKIATVLKKLDQMVMRMVFENYGMENDKYYDSHIGSTEYVVRFTKYKVLQNDPVGLPNHTDKTFTTILHQNHVNGLEIQLKNGEWTVYDPPSPSHTSFLYLAGEALKVWSNKRIRPCLHRVILGGNETRYSLGLFTFINGIVEIPDKLVDDEHPKKYKPFDHLEYLKLQMNYGYVDKIEYPVEDYCGI